MLANNKKNRKFANISLKYAGKNQKNGRNCQQGGIIMGLSVEYLEQMLSELVKRKELANIELEKCPWGILSKVRRGDHDTFFQSANENKSRKRLGITKKPEIIEALARKAMLQREIEIINGNIKALQTLLKTYTEPTFENIVRDLSDYITQNIAKPKDDDVWPNNFEQSTYKLEDRRFITSTGLKVRSKSELLIAEKLNEFGLKFLYEPSVKLGEYDVVPDFVIKEKNDGNLFYWEHCGLTNNEKYMNRHKWKMELYEQNGIVPWKNLIVTYDNGDGLIDMRIVVGEIKNKLL